MSAKLEMVENGKSLLPGVPLVEFPVFDESFSNQVSRPKRRASLQI